jgi:MFS family permease
LVWYVTRIGLAPEYLKIWLPGTLIVGLGIGLTFPVLSAAAVSSLKPARYAVGSAVNQTARQVGGALGVAILVVILGTPTNTTEALGNFKHLWLFVACMAALAGVICTGLSRAKIAHSELSSVELDVEKAHGIEAMLDGEIVDEPFAFLKPHDDKPE